MLSSDELTNGRIFILQLWDAAGVPSQWAETLRGETARRWYDIYRTSNWDALRAEASGVFHNRLTDDETQALLGSRQRCLFLHTRAVGADDLAVERQVC